jgi:hypothetical protein
VLRPKRAAIQLLLFGLLGLGLSLIIFIGTMPTEQLRQFHGCRGKTSQGCPQFSQLKQVMVDKMQIGLYNFQSINNTGI